ncbi:MAG: hypothetical protein GF393_01010 [Armatimonadia bacterium]|nr:hypothetical protein [Armatimonadia bacterium]
MLPKDASIQALHDLFRKHLVADLDVLFDALDTRSRMSVFRRLKEIGYLSSYTHTGRYYTLADIPKFDAFGLWFHQAIGFSRFGTLKATIAQLVDEADAGCTHAELEALLRLRVYNTLLLLVHAGQVRRDAVGGSYVYVSIDEERASRQLDARRQQAVQVARPSHLPPDDVVLLVVVEALHASDGLAAASVVAARLVSRGENVAAAQVEQVYEHFGLEPGKKTAAPL